MPPAEGKDIATLLRQEEELDALDPLRHFLAPSSPTLASSTCNADTTDIRDLTSSNDYSIIPQQIESIIEKRTTIRYYKDLSRRPELISDPSPDADGRGKEWWDVALKLDMTKGCGGKIWPAAEVLGAYIAGKYSRFEESKGGDEGEEKNKGYYKNGFDWRGKTIIELGSGTGLVGYLVHALCLSNTRILVTDQDVMLPLMRENLLLNFPSPSSSSSQFTSTNTDTGGLVEVAELDWDTAPGPKFTSPQPDVLLLADCVYLESAFQPLIDTMAALSTKDTEILFCYQKRRKADRRFFAMLKKGFVFEDVADDDEERREEYRRQGTQLLRIRKK